MVKRQKTYEHLSVTLEDDADEFIRNVNHAGNQGFRVVGTVGNIVLMEKEA